MARPPPARSAGENENENENEYEYENEYENEYEKEKEDEKEIQPTADRRIDRPANRRMQMRRSALNLYLAPPAAGRRPPWRARLSDKTRRPAGRRPISPLPARK